MQDAERALAMKGMQVIDRNIEVEGIRVASAASGKSDQPYGGLQLHQMAQVRGAQPAAPLLLGCHRERFVPAWAPCSAGIKVPLPPGVLRHPTALHPSMCCLVVCGAVTDAVRQGHSIAPGKGTLASLLRASPTVSRCSLLSFSSSPWQPRWHRCVLRPSSIREPMWAKVSAPAVSIRVLLRHGKLPV